MKNIEDIYPLSPMQELMILHSLSGVRSDALTDQACYTLQGDLDVAMFQKNWQRIVEHHPALRTAFLWENLKQPLQVVRRDVELPFQEFDLCGLSGDEQQTRLKDFLRSDRRRGFQLSQAPLMRLALFRLAPDESYFICSSHHLILDRWCISIIHDELSKLNDARVLGQPKALERPTPYRKYIAWVQQQDVDKAQEFWRKTLSGFVTATPLVAGANARIASTGKTDSAQETLQLAEETTKALREVARQNGLTLGTLFQGAWALVLSELTGQHDVVFGITVVGRPPDLVGVESIVGCFINNLPVRVRLNPAESLIEVLREIQAYQQRMRPFEYVSLAQIHQWSDLPKNQALFDTLLVQLAAVEDPQAAPNGLHMRAVSGPLRTAAPLTVALADTDPQISIQIGRNRGLSDTAKISDLLQLLQSKLAVLPSSLPRRLGELTRTDAPIARTLQTLNGPKQSGSPRPASGHLGEFNRVTSAPKQRTIRAPELEALEQQLSVEWQEILGIQVIDLNTSFFDLGGTSIQAVRLHMRLQIITRKEIALVQLFMSPTLQDMALLLHEQNWPACPEPIAAIQPEGSKPPLFCIATPEAIAIGYTALARHLGTDQPLYLVQSPPTTEQPMRMTPEELSAAVDPYMAAIRSVQRHGPYSLVGMCWGAYLAFDIAQELNKSGETIAFLGILDTWAKYTMVSMTPMHRLQQRLTYYANRLQDLSHLDPREQLSALRKIVAEKITNFGNGVTKKSERDDEHSRSIATLNPWEEFVWAKPGLLLEKYDGCITVFRRRKQPHNRNKGPDLGWGDCTSRVEIQMLTCKEDYTAILREPYVKELADRIKARLDDMPQPLDSCDNMWSRSAE